jgi:hypothetical protein
VNATKAPQRKRPCRSRALSPIPSFAGHQLRGIVMNTAVARRLALSDSVVWIGKDGYQPTGLGTITRITAHEVEVRWDGGTVTRYRRAHLHNLRHVKLITETVDNGRRPDSMRGCAVAARRP